MTTTSQGARAPELIGSAREIDLDIVIPVYNEQAEIASSIMLLRARMDELAQNGFTPSWQIVIADNASTDLTWELAGALVREHPATVRAMRIPEKGRGRALKLAWGASRARVVAYMDVDLSTDIGQIPELVQPILTGRADLAFGSRLLPDSDVERCLKREVISRAYNLMLRTYLGVSFHDAQCGFKALSAEAAAVLLPRIEDNEWFFDTELLVRAERLGLASAEIPVRWREDTGSTVHIVDTVRKDIAGMRRLRREARMEQGGTGGSAPAAGFMGTGRTVDAR